MVVGGIVHYSAIGNATDFDIDNFKDYRPAKLHHPMTREYQPCCPAPVLTRPAPSALSADSTLLRETSSQATLTTSRGPKSTARKSQQSIFIKSPRGAVRSYKLLADGRRQIGAFHLIGDIFGLENGEFHRFTAEAIVDTSVRLIKRNSLERVAEADLAIAHDLLYLTTDNLQHAEEHMLLLGRKTSLERVVAFLLEMDRRLTAAGIMILPMCRRDIADYLGLTLETVSRALSKLHEDGILGFALKTTSARSCF